MVSFQLFKAGKDKTISSRSRIQKSQTTEHTNVHMKHHYIFYSEMKLAATCESDPHDVTGNFLITVTVTPVSPEVHPSYLCLLICAF